ncbi:hypothetical protein [Actinacidiphila sp. ITFR-21]|uniref:hypothetical protein n=1 Tax=Actinacidiphila sp. ITFR-21 TaxID=3075199 RepID=UPI00288C2BF3|nr:hypothetical protein [Streptomyces sp. ITFR-21]WNI17642.1 hypothetical protein RLT57_20345 [Streptomyces sp. ITFR-21]WNI17782.1 hypothetical protein RLT57_21060 [Streptomyces sp. ITFR-21]
MFKTRREPENPYLDEARRRIGKMTLDAAREYSISIWAYGMRVAENPTEYLDDDLGEWDMALATLQAIRERMAGA